MGREEGRGKAEEGKGMNSSIMENLMLSVGPEFESQPCYLLGHPGIVTSFFRALKQNS